MKNSKKKTARTNISANGITLIALVITIIVLLILAGVSISMVLGDNGIISKASTASEKTDIADDKEKIGLAMLEYEIIELENNPPTLEEFLESKDWCDDATLNESEKIITILMTNGREYDWDVDIIGPGLYEANSDCTVLIKDWNTLISEGIIHVENGMIYCNADLDAMTNSDVLAGYLLLPKDGSITSIGENAFRYCYNLTDIILPDSITDIGEYAFEYCTSIENISIPDNITTLPGCAFRYCTKLSSVTFGENSKLTTIGPKAFSNSSISNFTIPHSVTEIGKYVFFGCNNLTSINIPNNVTIIGENAFASSQNLTSITIGNGVNEIGSSAFSLCINLTNITFIGTVEEWNNITLGTLWNNNVPATEVICSNGTVSL